MGKISTQKTAPTGRHNRSGADKRRPGELNPRPQGRATETKVVPDPDLRAIDNSRPDLPDENAEGQDELTESIIRAVEDTPADQELPFASDDEPIEPAEAIDNQAEFPGLTDQEDGEPAETPKPRK